MNEKKLLRIFNIGKINVAAVAAFFCVFIAGLCLSAFCAKAPYVVTGHIAGDAGLAVGLVIVGVAAHEALHALGAVLFGRVKKEDIRFGANIRGGVFFCHVKTPVTVKAYMGMLALPLLVTLIPYALVIAFGGTCLLAAFSLLLAGCAGDVAMLIGLCKEKDKTRKVLDHPDTTAYYVLVPEEEADFTELTAEEEKELIENDRKNGGVKLGIKIILIAIFLALFALCTYLIALIMRFV